MNELDSFELDSISDIAKTEGFDVLLSQIEALANHHEEIVVQWSRSQPLPDIRLASGRASGIRLVLGLLTQAKERSRNGR